MNYHFKKFGAILLASILSLSIGTVAFANTLNKDVAPSGNEVKTEEVKNKDTANNYFEAGQMVTLSNESVLDAFVAGNEVSILSTEVNGVAAVAGNTVSLNTVTLGSDLFVAGNNMSLLSVVSDGNIMAASNVLLVDSKTSMQGFFGAGANITFNGAAKAISLSGDEVHFNGVLDGDGTIEGQKVVIGDDAVINGKLTIKSEQEPKISSLAQVSDYEFKKITKVESDTAKTVKKVGIFARMLKKVTSRLFWIPAMLLVGLFYCLLFNRHLDTAKAMVENRTLAMLLTGAVSWIAVPVCAIVLSITCIGLPLAGIIITIYVLILCTGMSFAGASLARLAFPKMNSMLASMLGIAILCIVDIIPIVGTLASIAADIYMLGYVVQYLYLGAKKSSN